MDMSNEGVDHAGPCRQKTDSSKNKNDEVHKKGNTKAHKEVLGNDSLFCF